MPLQTAQQSVYLMHSTGHPPPVSAVVETVATVAPSVAPSVAASERVETVAVAGRTNTISLVGVVVSILRQRLLANEGVPNTME
jgi:hypothetical protein